MTQVLDENEYLLIKIENTKPIELYDFSNSFLALHNQYKRFTQKKYKNIDENVKLYVNELKEGSKIVKVVRFFKMDKLFQELIIKKFNEYLKMQFDAFLEQKLPELEEKLGHKLTKQELIELRAILKHNANDYNSKIHFEAGQNNSITNNFYYEGVQTRAISDEIEKGLINLNENLKNDFQNEILQLSIKKTPSGSIVIKGIIDSVETKEIQILFNSEEIKEKMLNKNEDNPFKVYYVVNGEIKRVNGEVKAYLIKELIQIIDDKEE
jgi:hypothetical protein